MEKRPHISVQNLSVYFDNQQILKNVSIDIPDHRITAIIGPSGWLLVRLADGATAEVPLQALVPRVTSCTADLAAAGARLVVIWCAGDFPDIACPVPVLRPGRLLPACAAEVMRTRNIGVVTPVPGQVEAARAKWQADGFAATVTWAAPGNADDLARAGRELTDAAIELVVLDCMGHGEDARRDLARASGHPVISAQSLTARVARALVAPDRRHP